MFRFLSEIKDFFIEPVFSNWVGLSKIGRKLVVLEIRRHFRASIFSLKFEIFFQKKTSQFFFLFAFIGSFPIVCWLCFMKFQKLTPSKNFCASLL